MIENLRIRNFKAWQDTGDIRFAPLTVFFGSNSSGKTSIHQLLLLLKQTAQSSDRKRVLHLGDRTTLVDLGSFSDVVFNHDTKTPLEFALRWRTPSSVTVKDTSNGATYESDVLSLTATIGQGDREQLHVVSMQFGFGDIEEEGFQLGMTRESKGKFKGKFNLTAEGYQIVSQRGRQWPLPPPYHFYGFPDEAVAYRQNTGFLADLTLQLETLLGNTHYVGPLREYPERLYIWSGEVPEHVGRKGERAVEALLAGTDRLFNFKRKYKTKPLQEVVAQWLKNMELIDSFEVKRIAENRKEYEVLVQTRRKAPKVKITDVGFGVSQVLPVIVECFYVPAHSIVIFEQPEIHLHPRVQADLADLFIDAIHAREESVEREVQFIVESHSEHFLRRLQRRIAEEKLRNDEVALYFCTPPPMRSSAPGAVIESLETDPYGNIRNWPEHFFGDEVEDLTAMTEAAMQRQMKGRS
jgi:predicted ATPase